MKAFLYLSKYKSDLIVVIYFLLHPAAVPNVKNNVRLLAFASIFADCSRFPAQLASKFLLVAEHGY